MTHEDHVLIATAALADVELRYNHEGLWFAYRRGRLINQYGWYTAARASNRALYDIGLRTCDEWMEYAKRSYTRARTERTKNVYQPNDV